MSNKQRFAGWATFIGELTFLGVVAFIIMTYYTP